MGRLIAKILAWLAILLGLALLIQPTAPAAEETTAEPPEPERAYPELYLSLIHI